MKYGAKPLLQIGLLIVFFYFFGWPSVLRFSERKVMVIESRKNTGGIKIPAITIAGWNRDSKNGWKSNTSNGWNLIEFYCSNTNVDRCINDKTFNETELLHDFMLGFSARESLMTNDHITIEDFTSTWNGRSYTLNTSRRISPNDEIDQLYIVLNSSKIYVVFLHDDDYFFMNSNPEGLPSIMLKIDPRSTASIFYRLDLTEVEELDLPEDPCNTDPDYHFQASVLMSLLKVVRHNLLFHQHSIK